jgi:hypothetical protein
MAAIRMEESVPDVSTEQRASNEFVKLVRKLRWMGMETEAKQVELAMCRLPAVDTVLSTPYETD